MESLERKEEAGESMNEFIIKYKRVYFNNTITKCAWQRYTNSQLFLLDVNVAETLRVSVCRIQRCIYE